MNDFRNASKVVEFILFADDTDLFATNECSISITRTNFNESLNSELSELQYCMVDTNQAHVEYNENQPHVFFIPTNYMYGLGHALGHRPYSRQVTEQLPLSDSLH